MTNIATELAARQTPTHNTILQLLEKQRPAIERARPKYLDAERFTRIILTELRNTPTLLDCNPESLLGAMMLSAQLGLEPGPLGHVYLVPYKRRVTFIIGYRGMIHLAQRSGRLASIVARTVYQGDGFEYEYGTREHLYHKPCPPADRGAVQGYYLMAKLANPTGKHLAFAYPEEIEARRKRSELGRQGKGPWHTDYEAMAHKSLVRMSERWLPLSAEYERAMVADDSTVRLAGDEVVIEDAEADGERES